MKPPPFVFMNLRYTYRGSNTWQQIKNEYFWSHLEGINQHMVKYNLTFEWKEKMMNRLIELVGYPVKQKLYQRILATLMF